MPKITIPKEYAEGLSKIINLSADDSQKLVSALEKVNSYDPRAIAKLVSENLSSLTIGEAREIVRTLLSLYAARTGTDTKVDAFVAEVIVAAKHRQIGKPENLEPASKTLKAILSVRPLSMISKARGVHTSYERTFCSARVLTDVRPVFDADLSEEPAGVVVAHVLRLGYHRLGKHTAIDVAMDKADIDTMIAILQRAKEKAATVRSIATKAKVEVLAE